MLLTLKRKFPSAILALEDGTVFIGASIGAQRTTVGEVVFNTAMSGYQEILTDPSYCQQIVTLTYPHIGSYGTNQDDIEGDRVFAAGLIIKDLPLLPSNFRHTLSLDIYLKEQKTTAIANIDTRQLTRHLRNHGAQNGCLMGLAEGEEVDTLLIENAIALAKSAPTMSGLDLAKVVSVPKSYKWTQSEWKLLNSENQGKPGYGNSENGSMHVVAIDFGVKKNILRMLVERGCRVTVMPAQSRASDILALKPDGIFLSNGPGDPEPCDYAIKATKLLLETGIPIFGICLGHQIMALASGAKTFKMKFGHHGANHPVKNLDSGRVGITSQNHGIAVDQASLPTNLRLTHISLFDGTVQGLERKDKPAFSFQGHPEASPGPNDTSYLFDYFAKLMTNSKKLKNA